MLINFNDKPPEYVPPPNLDVITRSDDRKIKK